jgi:hypothetical protein
MPYLTRSFVASLCHLLRLELLLRYLLVFAERSDPELVEGLETIPIVRRAGHYQLRKSG